MATVRDFRRLNLLNLINAAGKVQTFADAIQRSHSQVSQLRNEIVHSSSGAPRSLGNTLARHIEASLGLEVGWMDVPHSEAEARAIFQSKSGGSSLEPGAHAYSVSPSNNKRLKVSEWVKAGHGGVLEPLKVSEEDLGFVDLHETPDGLMAIRVRGDGLRPAIEDGRVLVVAPGVAAEPEEWVLVETRDGARHVKKLLNRKTDSVTVSDLKTDAQQTILFEEIASMDPITAVYSSRQWQRSAPGVRGMSVFGDLDDGPTDAKDRAA